MTVTRTVLPVMRKQRSGHVVTISSSAGLAGFEFCTAYSASKTASRGSGGARARSQAVRHPHHDRQPGVLPHRAAHRGVDELRRAVHRGLPRARRRPARVLDQPEQPADRGPGQACPGLLTITGEERPPRASSPAPTRSQGPSSTSQSSSRRPTPSATSPARSHSMKPRQWRAEHPAIGQVIAEAMTYAGAIVRVNWFREYGAHDHVGRPGSRSASLRSLGAAGTRLSHPRRDPARLVC
jgi:hypothetical protein